MDWKTCKLITLQKMFEAEDLILDDSQEYLSRMWGVANEAMFKIIEVKPLLKKHAIDISPNPENLLGNTMKRFTHEDTDITFDALGRSFYFEVKDRYYVEVTTSMGIEVFEGYSPSYKSFKGTCSDGGITITFGGDFLYSFRNVAIFKPRYFSEEEVPNYGRERKFDLRELPDFYSFDLVSNNQSPRKEGEWIISFDYHDTGYYEFYYHAIPELLSAETEGDFIIDLDEDCCVLMPSYMAGQLYKDDEMPMAIQYLNEFEMGLNGLRMRQKPTITVVDL